MFESILGLVILGGAFILQLAEDDFDVDKMAERQLKEQEKKIDEKIKELDKKGY